MQGEKNGRKGEEKLCPGVLQLFAVSCNDRSWGALQECAKSH